PALRRRARMQLEATGAGVLVCDVAALEAPDAVAVDALARLQLEARRLGAEVRLRHPSLELLELLALFGLAGVLPVEATAPAAAAARTGGTGAPCPGTS
ncbi:MAG TPA: STAS domain-containing protein, partial [Solirubrobacteraceae bacterium]|nr:STAS domain-containing protein [Solirubrobacteraceae bacterium]